MLERPVVNPDPRVVPRGAGKFKHRARRSLNMDQVTKLRIGQRGMRDDDLMGRERARVILPQIWPATEKRDLESQRVGGAFIKPARDVPPLNSEFGMAPRVPRESHSIPRDHRRKRRDR